MLGVSPSALPRFARLRDNHEQKNLYIAVGLILLFLISWSRFISIELYYEVAPTSHSSQNAIFNSTLGFQRIFALALANRKDRILPLVDAANATDLSITVLTAVRDDDIHKDSYPTGWNAAAHKPGELGCVVSHVRTWNKMVADGISSALILESDADWDLRIKQIMAPLSRAISTLVDFPFPDTAVHPDARPDFDATLDDSELKERDKTIAQPYAEKLLSSSSSSPIPKNSDPYHSETWDIIWLGHCGVSTHADPRVYSWLDSSAPPAKHEWTISQQDLNGPVHSPGTRTLHFFSRATCSAGYAISNRGATKLIEYFRDADSNFDLQLSQLCTSRLDLVCLSVWPQVVTAVGSYASNIDHGDGDSGPDDRYREPEDEEERQAGAGLQFSARRNAFGILKAGGRSTGAEGGGVAGTAVPEWEVMYGHGKNGTWTEQKLNRTEAVTLEELEMHAKGS